MMLGCHYSDIFDVVSRTLCVHLLMVQTELRSGCSRGLQLKTIARR